MNYRHIYHAGNFADAFKHIVLIALTKSFLNKPAPFCYLETHAGTGIYDLLSKPAQINQEYNAGIEKIRQAANPPTLIQEYLACVNKANPDKTLRFYPGSPFFVNQFLRPEDQMILNELHPEDFQILRKKFSQQKNISVHKQNGYLGLTAFLPPKQRRGFVLIDPPYEKPDEFEQLITHLTQATQRWPTGVFALWYPIKHRKATDRFLEKLRAKIAQPMLKTELSIHPEDTEQHLNGSGLLIINPPWKLQEEMEQVLPWLWQILSIRGLGGYQITLSN